MQTPRRSLADRFYRALLRILPFDFRSEFGGEMELVFQEQRTELERERGITALAKMWWATIVDIFRMAPREHFSVLSQDLRYAARAMRKNPGFTMAAVLILGLGIGANTAIFSVVNSVLLKALPYSEGDRLVVLRNSESKLGIEDANFSVPEIRDFRERNSSLSEIVEYHNMTFTLLGGAEARSVRTGVVSPRYFDFFGVVPLMGRTFTEMDDRPGADAVLILSYEFWKRAEGGDPNIVGKKYEMNDRVHTVVGVLPPIPQYPYENDVYMPPSSCPSRSSQAMITNRDARMMNLFGRLKPGETLPHCRTDLANVSARLAKDFPGSYPETAGFAAAPSLLRQDLTREARPLVLILLGGAAFVLLIACANVANLMLSRMARRSQELMIRTAMGAGSGRLLRQLLTESFLLAALGAAAGLLLAGASLHLLTDFMEQLTPRAREIAIDRQVLAFAILCAGATTILCGSVSALYSRHDLSSGLKDGGRSSSDRSGHFVRNALIVSQVAFSYVLLIGAGLMINSFSRLIQVHPGFAVQSVYAVGIDMNGKQFADAKNRLAIADRILEKVKSQPGVLSAAVASSFPLDPDNINYGGQTVRFQVEGDPRPESELPPVSTTRRASPEYFETLGIPLISGRTFRDSDNDRAPMVVLMNQALALKRWGNRDPAGKRITFDNGTTWLTVIGVVGNVKEFGLATETPYQVYLPLAQAAFPGSVLVRVAGNPRGMVEQIRRAIHEVDPAIAIVKMKSMEEFRADSVASPRTMARLFALFGIIALVIAVGGIASMLALWVRQRMREIGIRMALGASPRKILGDFLWQGMALVAAGLLLGGLVSLAAGRLIATVLFQVKPHDPLTYAIVSGVLLLAALIACYPPARRASGVDPQLALRCE